MSSLLHSPGSRTALPDMRIARLSLQSISHWCFACLLRSAATYPARMPSASETDRSRHARPGLAETRLLLFIRKLTDIVADLCIPGGFRLQIALPGNRLTYLFSYIP